VLIVFVFQMDEVETTGFAVKRFNSRDYPTSITNGCEHTNARELFNLA
jgi:hypothetical protein